MLELISLIKSGENARIQAIKLYREQTGMGLKEAKEAVDSIYVSLGLATWAVSTYGKIIQFAPTKYNKYVFVEAMCEKEVVEFKDMSGIKHKGKIDGVLFHPNDDGKQTVRVDGGSWVGVAIKL